MCRESREDKECLLTKSRKDKKDRKRIVVAATGASGLPILKMCLQIIRGDSDYESILILSDSAKITLQQETKDTVEEIEALADQVCDTKDIGAGPASGSFRTEGMLIVPCSMKTVAGIHSGYADNLILRAADVTIKEQRTLVLAARETPLSAIHLRNLSELATIPGVRIIPPMMILPSAGEYRRDDISYCGKAGGTVRDRGERIPSMDRTCVEKGVSQYGDR